LSNGQSANKSGMNAADTLLQVAREQGLDDQPAILTPTETITYAELERKSCQYGQALRNLGVGTQDRVLLLIDDRPEMFFCYLGAMKIGAVPVALNLRVSVNELRFIVTDSACKVIAAEADYLDLCLSACEGAPEPPVVVETGTSTDGMDSLDARAGVEPDELSSVLLEADDMALWMYTSGTTGTSKGAVHLQKSIDGVGRYLGPVYGVGPGDKVFCSSKLFFAFSLGHSFLATLRLGAAAVLHTGWPSAQAISETVEQFHPDMVFSVPTMYRGLLVEGLAASDGFKAVRHYISAGEHLPEKVFAEWQAVTGHPILSGIGATETLVMFIANRPLSAYPGATGTPLPETDVRLVSHDGEDISEPGLPGVVWVRSASLADRYWNQPDKTEAALIDGWYCTGDVFVRDEEGHYFYQGRDDDMLKISGQWVSPAEIDEYVLKNAKVYEAATVGIENEQGLTRLALCLVPERPDVDRETLQAELTEELMENLSVYKCPRRFVYLDEMPKTATGKIQRFKLRQFAADQLGRPQ
jgi:3-hydroxybenzoate/4-hydroxybenzoate---CoA ligase